MERLGRANVNIPDPWVEGDPLGIALISSSGVICEHGVDVAATSPEVGGTVLATFTLPGVYVGGIPVLIGLLWFPFLCRLSVRWLNFFLSLTIGLLLFLGVDAVDEAIDNAEGVAGACQGIALAAVGFILAFLAIGAAYATGAIALGTFLVIGFAAHNTTEGLAIATPLGRAAKRAYAV